MRNLGHYGHPYIQPKFNFAGTPDTLNLTFCSRMEKHHKNLKITVVILELYQEMNMVQRIRLALSQYTFSMA